jgi:hypothetical protein
MKHEQWRFDLLKAAQLIRANGLQKGRLHGPDGYCILGAINAAIFGLGLFDCWSGPYQVAFSRLGIPVGVLTQWNPKRTAYENNYFSISQWNDRPERTAQEVIDLLERAAGDAA